MATKTINIRWKFSKKPTPIYKTWLGIKYRCHNPKSKSFINYGARGVTVCEQWVNSFETFYEDMASSYRPGLTIDRIDNSQGYYKENCRWATRIEQANNKRNVERIEFNGESLTIAEWARKLKIKKASLFNRIYYLKWPLAEALKIETRPRKNKMFGLPPDYIIEINGERKTLSQRLIETKLSNSTITTRFYCYNWPIEKCFVERFGFRKGQ